MRMKNIFKNKRKSRLMMVIVLISAVGIGSLLAASIADKREKANALLQEVSMLADSLRYQEAMDLLSKHYTLIKDDGKALVSYGYMAFHIFGDYDRAKDLFGRAILLDPEDPEALLGMGDALFTQGDVAGAITYYEKAAVTASKNALLPLDAEAAMCWLRCAAAFLEQEDISRAIHALEKSVTFNPFSAEATALLHRLYVEDQDYTGAYNVWIKEYDREEAHGSAYIAEQKERYISALDSPSGAVHLEMALLYDGLALYEEAAKEYQRVLEQHPEDITAQERLTKVTAMLNFCRVLDAQLDGYYRDRCVKGPSLETEFYRRIQPAYQEIATLYPELNTTGGSAFSTGMINREIEKDFHVRIQVLQSGGDRLGLHLGRIADQTVVNKMLWSKERALKLITLSHMVSNGIDSWRSFGRGGVGGWSAGTAEIVRVVTNDESNEILQLASLFHEDAQRNFLQQWQSPHGVVEKRAPLELFFDPAIKAGWIIKQIQTEVLAAKAEGISEDALQEYLFRQIEKRFYFDTSICIHESQHALDAATEGPVQWTGGVEYRPKMSQLVYGEMPFLSLNQFYGPWAGQENGDTHQRANNMILSDIVLQVAADSALCPDIDRGSNILAQLYLLTDDELRRIAAAVFNKHYPDEAQ